MVGIAPEPSVLTTAFPPSESLLHVSSCPHTVILASKISQDKCYSNHAWAKLSGLPPREIGRCERALGQSLDWRLWVGKKALESAPAALSRAIVRTQSESCITILPSLRELFMPPSEPKPSEPQSCPNLATPSLGAAGGVCAGKGLRRCCTVPTVTFTDSRLPLTPSGSIVSQEESVTYRYIWSRCLATAPTEYSAAHFQ